MSYPFNNEKAGIEPRRKEPMKTQAKGKHTIFQVTCDNCGTLLGYSMKEVETPIYCREVLCKLEGNNA